MKSGLDPIMRMFVDIINILLSSLLFRNLMDIQYYLSKITKGYPSLSSKAIFLFNLNK